MPFLSFEKKERMQLKVFELKVKRKVIKTAGKPNDETQSLKLLGLSH